jgi:hypothetical protein
MASTRLKVTVQQENEHKKDIAEDTSFSSPRSNSGALTDSLVLAVVFLLSTLPYISGLGFYSDDWGFLARMTTTQDSSFTNLIRELYVGDVVLRQRPVQVLLLALFYSIFGLAPLGYHLLNSFALLIALLLLYAILREMGQHRLVALTVPLLYGVLPNYATDRFWLAAFQATFSMTFYFLSLYADLRALRALPMTPRASVLWKLVSLVVLLLSVFAYEVVLPLFVLNPLLLWIQGRQLYPHHPPLHGLLAKGELAENEGPHIRGRIVGRPLMAKHWVWLVSSHFLVLVAAVLYKMMVSVRVGVGIEGELLSYLAFLVAGALRINYGVYGVGLPYIVWWILRDPPEIGIMIAATVAMTVIIVYLLAIVRQTKPRLRQERWGYLILFGFIIFGLGYAIFLINGDVWFTSAAVGNRVAIAATVGVSTSFIGLTGWFSSRLPLHYQGFSFALIVTLLVGAGFLTINALGHFWVKAYQEELRIVAAIQEEFPQLTHESTLLLDGVCPEIGAAIVFNGPVDLSGAVAVSYNDATLQANRITPELTIGNDGLTIGTFRRESFYPYSDQLWVFHYPTRLVTSLQNETDARNYFRDFKGDAACPPGFSWGWNGR